MKPQNYADVKILNRIGSIIYHQQKKKVFLIHSGPYVCVTRRRIQQTQQINHKLKLRI